MAIVLLASSLLSVAVLLPQDEPEKKPDAAAEEKESGASHSGRFTYEILTGVEFSQDKGEFSEENFLLRFVGDTSWRRESAYPDWYLSWLNDVHSSVAVTLSSIPAKEIDTDTATGTTDEFLTSKKAVTFAFGAESRWFKLAEVGPEKEKQTLFFGPIVRGGFSTLTESAEDTATVTEDVDSVNSFYGAGIRIGEGPASTDDDFNPRLVRYVDVHYSHYENLDGNRLTFDALLRPKSGKGFFIGARALVGEGEDDVRIYAGISLSTDALESAISGLSGLISF